MSKTLLTMKHIAREIHFAANGYVQPSFHAGNQVKPAKYFFTDQDEICVFGRIRNRRYKLIFNSTDLLLSLDAFSTKHIIPMLLAKRLIKVVPA